MGANGLLELSMRQMQMYENVKSKNEDFAMHTDM